MNVLELHWYFLSDCEQELKELTWYEKWLPKNCPFSSGQEWTGDFPAM